MAGAQIKDGNILQSIIPPREKWPDKKVNTKKYDDGALQKYELFNFFTAN